MNTFHSSILNRTIPSCIFDQLCQLWENMADFLGNEALLITDETIEEDYILPLHLSHNFADEKFYLLISPQFQALLLAQKTNLKNKFQISLTFQTEIIKDFINQLINSLENYPSLQNLLTSLDEITLQQSATFHNQFMMDILEIMVQDSMTQESNITVYPRFFAYQPIDFILQNRLEQERILNQMTLQINQNQDLLMILQITLEQVRSLLKIDRLVIYQLNVKLTNENEETELVDLVTYEAKSYAHIKSILHFREECCFNDNPEFRSKYRQGFGLIINDIAESNIHPCLKQLMINLEVKAKLVTPIIVQDQLWGFIIAHQCHNIRNWQPHEVKFLNHVAKYLAIAIYQSESYYKLQQQQKILEQTIERRATELKDALFAAEIANLSKSEFIGNMSHELRTPLTCIIGLSNTLLRWSFNNTTNSLPLEKQRQYLQTIQDSGQKLLGLINDILDFAQLEAGKSILKIKEFSLKNLCLLIINNIKSEAKLHEINLKLEIILEENQDLFCGDSERIEQILMNLLNNAIKFTPANGTVILRVWRERNQVIFQIEDTGIGISQKQLSLLFQKFQQLEPSRQKIYGGAGLGLALTKQLIDLLQGQIEVDSTLDQGSIFTVSLPNLSNYLGKNKHHNEQETLPQGETIIIITQDDEIATLICEMFTVAHYKIVWLIDNYIPLKQIKIINPCLVIIDITLMDIQDKMFFNQLKILHNFQDLKILILADNMTSEMWSKYSESGVNDHLSLPLEPQNLLPKVTSLLLNNLNS